MSKWALLLQILVRTSHKLNIIVHQHQSEPFMFATALKSGSLCRNLVLNVVAPSEVDNGRFPNSLS